MAAFKIISQIDANNTSFSTFHIILGEEVKQIGLIQYPVGTSWSDGVSCNEAITKALHRCYGKRIRSLQG